MDPTETLTQLLIAVHERDTVAMREHCENLAEWLDKGGFAPDMGATFERLIFQVPGTGI